MTPQQLRSVRRLHHEAAGLPRKSLIQVEAGQVIDVLNVVWEEVKQVDVQEATRAAENRLDDLLGTDA